MPPERNEEERREIIRRLERRYQEAETKRLHAEQEAAYARVEKSNLESARLRAQGPFPESDMCPECWIMHGKLSPLEAARADDPSRYDRWMCRACPYSVDREF